MKSLFKVFEIGKKKMKISYPVNEQLHVLLQRFGNTVTLLANKWALFRDKGGVCVLGSGGADG